MTVDELRKALEGVPGDMPIAVYEDGYLNAEDVGAGIAMVAPHPGEGRLRVICEYSRHPEGTKGTPVFLIS